MKRKHKQYSKPKRPFDKTRIEEEAKIKQDFGLKNKNFFLIGCKKLDLR